MLGKSITLDGAESVQDVYRERTRVGQSVFYTDDEKLAVSDDMIVSTSPAYQQTPGAILAAEGVPVDAEATYLVKIAEHMIWPYDDEGRLIGEGCLGIRRVGPRVHAVRPDRCPHRGASRQVARASSSHFRPTTRSLRNGGRCGRAVSHKHFRAIRLLTIPPPVGAGFSGDESYRMAVPSAAVDRAIPRTS
jgi:hypothetical protein